MDNLFQVVSLSKRSLLQKIFKQFPEDNAIREVNNLLATKRIEDINSSEISEISSRYRVNIFKIFPKNIEEFYAVYLNYCLKDKSLSEEEIQQLKRLKKLFELDDNCIQNIHNELASLIYKKSFNDILRDGRIDEKEREFIEKLKTDIHLTESIAKKISEEVRGSFVKNYLSKAISDEKLSPEEEKELLEITQSLNVNLNLDNNTKANLEKFKIFWLIENGELPITEVDINLQKSEVCYYQSYVDWYEERRGYMTIVDTGNVFLTNKRILFMGESKNTNIQLGKILSCTIHADGVEIDKEAGKVPILKTKSDPELMGRVLKRLIKRTIE